MKSDDAEAIREMETRKAVAYDYIRKERIARRCEVPLWESLLQMRTAFAYSLSLSQRPTSGFVDFYRALARLR